MDKYRWQDMFSAQKNKQLLDTLAAVDKCSYRNAKS
jgi:hypothetical protein